MGSYRNLKTRYKDLRKDRMEKIILLGGGGHCKVVIEAILSRGEFKIVGIIDKNKKKGQKVLGFPIIGNDEEIKNCFNQGIKNCFVAFGGIVESGLRLMLVNLVKEIGMSFPNIIHKNSSISHSVIMGEGNYFGQGVIVNSDAKVGNHCIVNTAAIIEHDCCIGDFAHIAPGVLLSGAVTVGNGTLIGIGTSIVQSITIGRNSIIGAGSVVVKDIGNNIVAYGNPCKEIEVCKNQKSEFLPSKIKNE